MAVGLLGLCCALLIPFAPVLVDQATLTWPKAGADPSSTTAFLVPYRPAEFHARVPCPVIRTALAQNRRSVVLATAAGAADRPTPGLAVIARTGRIQVNVGGRLAMETPPAPGPQCGIRVDADSGATTVAMGAVGRTRLVGVVPEVHAFVTDLDARQARGITADVRARNLFEARPTAVKLGLIATQLALVALSILLLVRTGQGTTGRSGRVPPPRTGESARTRIALWAVLIDTAVVLVLLLWAFIGPSTPDDGYALMTVRNAGPSGDIGNYYHWFNGSEAPFTTVQWLLRPLVEITIVPLWIRLPSISAAIATWFLISRGIVGPLLPGTARSWRVRSLTAVAFLAWWLPYNLGIRPEPFVALTIAATFALLLAATRPDARTGGFLQLAVAALLAGLAVSITPSGLLVFAPALVLAPRVWRTLKAGEQPVGVAVVAGRLALLCGVASTGLVVMFARQSWRGAALATEIHDEIGPSLQWYEELARYQILLGTNAEGNPAKRLVVLLSLVFLVVMVALLARGVRVNPGLRDVHLAAAVAAAGFLLLWPTPSKWIHHFGSMVPIGVPFLVVAVVTIATVVRTERSGHDPSTGKTVNTDTSDRLLPVLGLVAGGGAALAAGLSFSGPNNWWFHSALGVPWSGEQIRPLGLPLGNPVFWCAVAFLLGALWSGRGWAGRPALGVRDRGAIAVAVPAVLAVTALCTSVVILLGTFLTASVRPDEGYSMAGENLSHLRGSACGAADKVQVMPDVQGSVLQPAEGSRPGTVDRSPVGGAGTSAGGAADTPPMAQGFVEGRGFLSGFPPEDPPGTERSRFLWGSFAPNELITGTLVTQWFTLPDAGPGRELALSAAGRVDGANSVRFEFGRSGSDGSTREISASRPLMSRDRPDWRSIGIPTRDIPEGADRVRIRAVDRSVDIGGWLAVTGPRLREVVSLAEFLRDQGPTLIDWQIALSAPCITDFPVVAHGVAEAPAVWVTADPPEHGEPVSNIAYDEPAAGSFAGLHWTGSLTEVPSRSADGSDWHWGHVSLAGYPMARDAYDMKITKVRVFGWQGDR